MWFETPKCASSSLKSMLPCSTRSILPSRFSRRSDYFRFGVVRNPWAKMVSNYSMFVARQDYFRNGQIEELFGVSCDNLTFKRFIDLAEKIPNHHWAECYEFFPTNMDGSVDLDIVVRFENFAKEIRAIGDHLGISLDVKHRNHTKHRPYRDYYTADTRQQVAQMFEHDIEAFKYEF